MKIRSRNRTIFYASVQSIFTRHCLQIYLFYKHTDATELNDHLHTVSEPGKELSTMLIMSLRKSYKFNACEAI